MLRGVFRRLGLPVGVALLWLLSSAPPGLAAGCQYVLGFKAFHDANAAVVGDCVSNEQSGGNGTRVQQTANGILVWRPADNLIAFTNGAQTWVDGPFGVQVRANDRRFAWEGRSSDADPSVKGIFIQLSTESLVAYQDGQVVVQTPITTGGPRTPTPPGTFSVIGKRNAFVMKSPWPESDDRWYPDSWVNYALLYERSGYFIHDAPWRAAYGPGTNQIYNPYLDWTGTHGCVNVPHDAEATLYGWADLGTPVTVLP